MMPALSGTHARSHWANKASFLRSFTKSLTLAAGLCYLALLSITASRLSFWLDEVLQLDVTQRSSLQAVLNGVSQNPGAAPLGYVAQWLTLSVFGLSPVAARFPSILASAGLVFLLWKISRKLAINPYFSTAIFLVFPLQFRYATEARPYMLALFFATAGTLLFLRLRENPTFLSGLGYSAALICAAYTQPFAVFVAAAHGLWLLWPRLDTSRAVRRVGFAAMLFAALCVLPWFLMRSGSWSNITANAGLTFHFSIRTAGMLIREISGGYAVAALLLPLALLALWSPAIQRPHKYLLLLLLLAPSLLALTADAAFGYFVASRQFIFILPAYALLAAAGIAHLAQRVRWAGVATLAVVIASLAYGNVSFLTRSREDWAAAARFAATQLNPHPGGVYPIYPTRRAYSPGGFRADA